MKENQKLMRAIWACFAVENRKTLQCNLKLEDSVDAGRAFYEKLNNGSDLDLLLLADKLLSRNRYKNKMVLVNRYLNLNS